MSLVISCLPSAQASDAVIIPRRQISLFHERGFATRLRDAARCSQLNSPALGLGGFLLLRVLTHAATKALVAPGGTLTWKDGETDGAGRMKCGGPVGFWR